MASNMKAVKLRIKSVQSTMQITKAMELVASSKLRKAKERAEVCRPYFTELHETLKEIARENTDFSSVYAKESSNNKTCYVVIAGDRGLAGGYNTNLFKCLEASAEGKDYMVLPVGKKALNPVIAVQRILRLMPGEPPLVGHFVPGIGHKHFGYLVRNFDKLILCVPIIKILQIDCSHK